MQPFGSRLARLALWMNYLAVATNPRYVGLMSLKQQLAAAVERLPDNVTVEDAFERLYQAFKLKQLRAQPQQVRQPPKELAGTLEIYGDILSSALEPDTWDMLR